MELVSRFTIANLKGVGWLEFSHTRVYGEYSPLLSLRGQEYGPRYFAITLPYQTTLFGFFGD